MRQRNRTRRYPLRQACSAAMIVAAIIVTAMLCPGAQLRCQQWEKVVIDATLDGPVMPRVADMDLDGDKDVVVADWMSGNIFWYENTGNHVGWTRHRIGVQRWSPMGIGIADFDGDGRPDVAVAGWIGTALAWYQNNLPADSWPQDVLAMLEENADGGTWVDVGDIDGDGDTDILLTVRQDDNLSWFENAGGTPIAWTRRPIHKAEGIEGAQIVLCDMDADGDLDIVATMRGKGKVVWLESQRRGQDWTEHVIDADLPMARTVTVGDIDYDGDLDVVAGGSSKQAVVRYEQVGIRTDEWSKTIVDSTLDHRGRVDMLEIDGGPTREIAATRYSEGIVVWYRNIGDAWYREFIDSDLQSARGSCAADINGDGNDELIVAAQEGTGALVYYRNRERDPRIRYAPHTLDFGHVMVNGSAHVMLEISNSGEGILAIDIPEIMGSGAGTFSLYDPKPLRIRAGEKISRKITCRPASAGITKSALRIRSNDPLSPDLYINLVVNGVTESIPRLSCRPPVLDFGDIAAGETGHEILTITNLGTGQLSIDALRIGGTDPGLFSINAPCPFNLEPRQETSVTVFCTPTVSGAAQAVLHVESSDPQFPDVMVPMRVNGVSGRTPHIGLSARMLHFGAVMLDSTVQREVTITNTGDDMLTVDTLQILGLASCPFTLDDACCFTLAPGKTARRVISCTPTLEGITQDPLKITCNDPSCGIMYVQLVVDGVEDITNDAADLPLPQAIRLEQNFPNPFNPSTEIRYALPSFGTVQLRVHDLLGRRVATLVNDAQSGGAHRAVFDATGLPSGIYVYRLQWNGQTLSKTMMLIK